ncbi:hypothetical protein P691DRAFT_763249 [Macrolepiota fuliginosa MF-IS2]|uniref:Uncharacterized protein n=1 Tax=Macrolepiota fuliginosa MF-IS2 TaxID=1400762 RepID=A0A9P5X7L6_9AGAR|nr:hypothetical protein P691DRAFT_763249 [Macrolepiota fuliginosa MF-IS2]
MLDFSAAELLIIVNFTYLNLQDQNPSRYQLQRAVHIAIDTTVSQKAVNAAYQDANFFPLFPGHHLLESLSTSMAHAVENPELATFGIMKYSTIPVVHIGSTVANQNPTVQGTNISSLHLFQPLHVEGTGYEYSQEIKEYSPLGGLSILGGLWTFVSGMFAPIC